MRKARHQLKSEDVDASAPVEVADEAMAVEQPAVEAAAAPVAASRIDNDIEAVKQAFKAETDALTAALEAEKQRAVTQQDEIAALRQQIETALSARNAEADAEISALRDRLDKIQSGEGGLPAGREVAAAMALSALQRRVDQGAPFEQELEVLDRLRPESVYVERLKPIAPEGAPTLSVLKTEFPAIAISALAVAGRENAEGLVGAFMARIQSLVSVRPARPQAGESPRAVISRAESYLSNDDLSQAINELSALEGGAGEAFADWLAKASRRDEAARSLEALGAGILEQLQN